MFPVLKDEQKWDLFQHEMEAQVAAQDVEEVLNSAHVPTPGTDLETLFACKQKFMFAVFQRSLKTDKTQSILCNTPGKNAQDVWAAVTTHMKDSTAAQLDEDELLHHIINSQTDDGKWCGDNCSCILNWLEQVQLCNETSA